MSVIGYFSKPYAVEIGTYEATTWGGPSSTFWEFERGFDELTEAEDYAREVATRSAHVRVVDRTEEGQ